MPAVFQRNFRVAVLSPFGIRLRYPGGRGAPQKTDKGLTGALDPTRSEGGAYNEGVGTRIRVGHWLKPGEEIISCSPANPTPGVPPNRGRGPPLPILFRGVERA